MDLRNPILAALAEGRFQDGADLYTRIDRPSGEDHLWGGQCLVLARQQVRGLALLLRARAQGIEDGGALAASTYRFAGDMERVQGMLAALKDASLSPFGRAVALRERGLLLFSSGKPHDALVPLLDAWETAVGDDVARRFLASFSVAIGFVLTELGRDERALEYLDIGASEASAAQRAPVLWTRALAYLNVGRLDEAERDLNEVAGSAQTSRPLLDYYRGLLAHVRQQAEQAQAHFTVSAQEARAESQPDTEFYAQLMLSVTAMCRGNLVSARAHLARARHLAQGPRARSFLAWRQGALLLQLGDRQAAERLTSAAQAFEALGLNREVGLVHLHLAEARLREDQRSQALAHLEAAVDARHAVGGMTFALELRSLPNVLNLVLTSACPYAQVLAGDWQALRTSATPVLAVQSLGGYGLTLNGRTLRVEAGLHRTVEILTFLLHHGPATLEDVQTHVFADHDPQAARSYLHVARHALHKALPRLTLPFDRPKRTYEVRSDGMQLHWDVRDVRAAVTAGGEAGLRHALRAYSGAFLPQTDSSWAQTVRVDLEWSLVRLGLETLENLHSRGRDEACVDLARRLLEVNPLEEGVNALLVRAVHHMSGLAHGRAELERVERVYEQQLGTVPASITALRVPGGLLA